MTPCLRFLIAAGACKPAEGEIHEDLPYCGCHRSHFLALSSSATAQTQIDCWYAMGGELGTILEGTVANFNASQSDYEVIPSYRGSFTETVTGAIDAIRAGHNPTSFRFSKLVPPP